MKVLVACEWSGVVRDAFAARGHDAWSCDLLPTEAPGQHFQRDVIGLLQKTSWDLMIAHPPCTYLSTSGARWFKDRKTQTETAIEFVMSLMRANVNRICVENPVSVIASYIRPCDQMIQPWMFGHGETKSTCLWLKNLPLLRSTNVVEGREHRINMMPETPRRSKERSRFYKGIAEAMAEQWGTL